MKKKKRIIICADGTWKSADASVPTNVVKIKDAIVKGAASDDDVKQIVYYDDGLGAKGNFLYRFWSGLTGFGLETNILDCYKYVVEHYEKEDELYLFGFSRGAYTVRSLAGLLGNQGLLLKKDIGELEKVWHAYRCKLNYRQTPLLKPRVTCLGVWDTVGALGIPSGFQSLMGVKFDSTLKGIFRIIDAFSTLFDRGKRCAQDVPAGHLVSTHKEYGWHRRQFHNVDLGQHIYYAFHALAIDERRETFQPTLWTEIARDSRGRPAHDGLKLVKQVWFRGVHADVGGGYSQQGLSDLTLEWMIKNVRKYTKLKFDDDYIRDKIRPDPTGRPHNSYRPLFGERVWRKIYSCVTAMGKAGKDGREMQPIYAEEMVHPSVLKRKDSAPPNLQRVQGLIKEDK